MWFKYYFFETIECIQQKIMLQTTKKYLQLGEWKNTETSKKYVSLLRFLMFNNNALLPSNFDCTKF